MWDRYVGVPWVEKGRDLNGCDCWGLAVIVYRDELGVELPSYSDRYATTADREFLESLISEEVYELWRQVDAGAERPFDLALIRDGRSLSHVGIVVTPGKLLHVSHGGSSVIEPYRSGALKHHVVSFYCHHDSP